MHNSPCVLCVLLCYKHVFGVHVTCAHVAVHVFLAVRIHIHIYIHIHYYLSASCAQHTRASASCSTVKVTDERRRIPSYDALC